MTLFLVVFFGGLMLAVPFIQSNGWLAMFGVVWFFAALGMTAYPILLAIPVAAIALYVGAGMFEQSETIAQAIQALEPFAERGRWLREIAVYLRDRKN
jgi:hypothetical protein